MPKVNYRQGNGKFGPDILQRFPVHHCKTRPPSFVTMQNLIKALFEGGNVQVARIMNRYRLVVKWNVWNQLRMEPDLLLGVGQRHWLFWVSAWDCLSLRPQ